MHPTIWKGDLVEDKLTTSGRFLEITLSDLPKDYDLSQGRGGEGEAWYKLQKLLLTAHPIPIIWNLYLTATSK